MHNSRSSAVKRILAEHRQLLADPSPSFSAHPLENNLFEWHVTLNGTHGTDYQGGIYHLRLILPPNYPLSPPDIIILTPNGRFETWRKVCIDGITSHHERSWQPVWGIKTALTALEGFWNLSTPEVLAGYGALKLSSDEKKRFAKASPAYTCATCLITNAELMESHQTSLQESAEAKETTVLPPIVVAPENIPIPPSPVVETPQILIPIPAQPANVPLNSAQIFLLHPSLSHRFLPSPFKLCFHLLRLAFVPPNILAEHNLATSFDSLILLDTIIWIIGLALFLTFARKAGNIIQKLLHLNPPLKSTTAGTDTAFAVEMARRLGRDRLRPVPEGEMAAPIQADQVRVLPGQPTQTPLQADGREL